MGIGGTLDRRFTWKRFEAITLYMGHCGTCFGRANKRVHGIVILMGATLDHDLTW